MSYNVKDFGAKGDGVTDDTAAIERALEYAELESIVLDLAKSAPIVETNHMDLHCALCTEDYGGHDGDCPYGRAREWVRERDAEK